MTARSKLRPVIVIDCREQDPFLFGLPTEIGTLATGDYSIRGLDHLIAVERKSLPDLIGCVTRDRDRFKRELQRMAAYRFRLVAVEAAPQDITAGCWRGKTNPASVWGSIASWMCRYGVPFMLLKDHPTAGRFVERYLFQCARHIAGDYTAAAGFVKACEAVA